MYVWVSLSGAEPLRGLSSTRLARPLYIYIYGL